MSSAKQQLIGAGGAGLLLANFWTGPSRTAVTDGIFNPGATHTQTQAAKAAITHAAAALALVAVGTLAAGVSDQWASAVLVILLGLWIVWAINRFGGGAAGAAQSIAGGATNK